MRLHWKKGSMMRKDGHHHLKHKHFKRMVIQSAFNDDNLPCKKKHFKRMMKVRPGHPGKWKHFKGMRGHSSSDSDDSDHHHGKDKHFKHMLRGRSMLAQGHHGKWKHFMGMRRHSSSDSDDVDHHGKGKYFKHMMRGRSMLAPGHHHGKGKHFRGHSSSDSDDSEHHRGKKKHFKGWYKITSDDGPRGKGMQGCMPGVEKSDHHVKENFKHAPDRSMAGSDDQGMERNGMSANDGGHHHRRMDFMGRKGHPMTDAEGGHHSKGKHFKNMHGRSMSCSGDERMQRRRCMSDNEGGHHRRMDFMGMRGRPMTDIEEGHHGRGRHFKGHMSEFDDHHGKMKHMRGMMHHHKGKHWMKGHGKRGFFDYDSALVPICTREAEDCPETLESENPGNKATEVTEGTEAVVDENLGRTEQGTQTSGIMEIVIEDQEAQSAAIRIVNKFL